MSSIGDIAIILEKIPIWKRLKGLPSEVDALQARIVALETALKERPAQQLCPICGTGALKVKLVRKHPQFGDVGLQMHEVHCDNVACGHIEERMHDPLGRTGKK